MPFSAVTAGVAELRELIPRPRQRLRATGARTILFVDEIHRFNKAQQDAVPAARRGRHHHADRRDHGEPVVRGDRPAALPRARLRAQPLDAGHRDHSAAGARRRRARPRRRGARVDDDALALLAAAADGDARLALNALEAAADARRARRHAHVAPSYARRSSIAPRGTTRRARSTTTCFRVPQVAARQRPRRRALLDGAHDRGAARIRCSVPARDRDGRRGHRPRRPKALQYAVAARDAFHMLGPPEGYLPLAEMTIYLATAPKSNTGYRALHAALEAARETPAAPVPLHMRNAPTDLMRELGYGREYRYAHDSPDAYLPQEYLPEELRGRRFYTPGRFGREPEIAERMASLGQAARAPGGGRRGRLTEAQGGRTHCGRRPLRARPVLVAPAPHAGTVPAPGTRQGGRRSEAVQQGGPGPPAGAQHAARAPAACRGSRREGR